jgi:sterol desaturase/sphingolipid hydroxylase (fatty acid hydroxylase superfamily)
LLTNHDQLAEDEVKAILALGILASLAVAFQLHGLQVIHSPLLQPPKWIRQFEWFTEGGVGIFFSTYIGLLALWFAVKNSSYWEGKIRYASQACFVGGVGFIILLYIAFFLRVFALS